MFQKLLFEHLLPKDCSISSDLFTPSLAFFCVLTALPPGLTDSRAPIRGFVAHKISSAAPAAVCFLFCPQKCSAVLPSQVRTFTHTPSPPVLSPSRKISIMLFGCWNADRVAREMRAPDRKRNCRVNVDHCASLHTPDGILVIVCCPGQSVMLVSGEQGRPGSDCCTLSRGGLMHTFHLLHSEQSQNP